MANILDVSVFEKGTGCISIGKPDYLSIHPKDNSISFIKNFSGHISVAIRISSSGSLSYRTMYPITDAQLTNYIDKGRAWEWSEKG